jgi:Zn-finger nucleic acid-binding protein
MVYRESLRPDGICPLCKRALNPLEIAGNKYETCHGCRGSWVELATLTKMWDQMASLAQLPAFVARTGGAGPRPCPTCRQLMDRVALKLVPLDRCEAHGIWFDHLELETALAAAMLPEHTWEAMFFERLRQMT